ncbi:hypothetical protein BDV06DRAFT_72803 [Aspergillus oleicola]
MQKHLDMALMHYYVTRLIFERLAWRGIITTSFYYPLLSFQLLLSTTNWDAFCYLPALYGLAYLCLCLCDCVLLFCMYFFSAMCCSALGMKA